MDQPVTFGITTSQHHLTFEQLRDHWQLGERLGFDALYLFDHFTGLRGDEDGICLEASTLLAALAMVTTKAQIGVMVYGNTHRHPAILAKEIVTIDHLSGGRAILGIGTGWNENEHRWYGIELPPPGKRVRQFDEALTVIDGLMNNPRYSFSGDYYSIDDAPFAPKPVHGHIPVLIGGKGPKMLRVIAKHADIWDGGGRLPERSERVEELKRACDEVGRDFDTIIQSQGFGAAGLTDIENLDELTTTYLEAGVRHFHFGLPNDEAELDIAIRAATDILPKYRSA